MLDANAPALRCSVDTVHARHHPSRYLYDRSNITIILLNCKHILKIYHFIHDFDRIIRLSYSPCQ